MEQYDADFLASFENINTQSSPSRKKEVDGTYQAVMRKAGLKTKTPHLKKTGRILLIAAAIAVCSVVTAAAYGLGAGNLFKTYFENGDPRKAQPGVSLSESQVAGMDKAGILLNRSATDNGTVINIRAAMGDKNCAYLLLDVTAPTGTVLNKDEYEFEDMPIDFYDDEFYKIPNQNGGSAGWDILTQKDENPNDNKKSFVISVGCAGINLQNREIKMTLKNLSVPSGKLTYTPVVKGEWKFNFKLDYDTASKIIKVNKVSHDSNGYATIPAVNLSALSADVTFINMKYRSGTELYKPPKMIIYYKDGTQDVIMNGGGTGDEDCYTKVYKFNAPMDFNKVEKISIGDVEIPIK